MKLFIVDAFAEELFGGNPAGVILVDEEFPEEAVMQKVANELRYSESAFVKRMDDEHYKIRYFTPNSEVDLCGHATIASVYVLIEAGMVEDGSLVMIDTKAGELSVQAKRDCILMDMASPESRGTLDDEKTLRRLYEIMGLVYEADADMLIPEIISTGLPDIMLPVKDEHMLERIQPDYTALSDFSDELGVVGVHAFTTQAVDGLFHARNFAPLYDIDEEAATGTASGAMTYYLYTHALMEAGKVYEIMQGEKMQRPSKILTRILDINGIVSVKVGGTARILVSGTIRI